MSLSQQQLQEVYQMVDSIPLSRSKKNISRDFSDCLLMAQVIHFFNPKIVSIHNYPASNAVSKKITNWNTLNTKVLKKLGMYLSKPEIQDLANSVPNAIQKILYQVLVKFEKPDEQSKLTTNARNMDQPSSRLKTITHRVNPKTLSPLESKQYSEEVINEEVDYRQELEDHAQNQEMKDLLVKIDQSYSQLLKLNDINKAKEDMVRNLQKKLERILTN